MAEYALYRGEEFLFAGTAEECANFWGIKAASVKWMCTPTGKRRFEGRKHKERCITAIKLEDEDD
jgi:hypothetical protein